MKRITVTTGNEPHETIRLNGLGPHAVAISQILAEQPNQRGLSIHELIDQLAARGILTPRENETQTISNLMQRLLKAGITAHPRKDGSSHRYVLAAKVITFQLLSEPEAASTSTARNDLWCVKETADHLGVTDGYIRRLCLEYRIGRKIGRDRLLTSSDVDDLKKRIVRTSTT